MDEIGIMALFDHSSFSFVLKQPNYFPLIIRYFRVKQRKYTPYCERSRTIPTNGPDFSPENLSSESIGSALLVDERFPRLAIETCCKEGFSANLIALLSMYLTRLGPFPIELPPVS